MSLQKPPAWSCGESPHSYPAPEASREGPRLEFNAEGPTFVLEETRELSRHHAVDFRLVFLNDQMNARVRERLLDLMTPHG